MRWGGGETMWAIGPHGSATGYRMGAQINLPFFQFSLRWVRRLDVEPQTVPWQPRNQEPAEDVLVRQRGLRLAGQLKPTPADSHCRADQPPHPHTLSIRPSGSLLPSPSFPRYSEVVFRSLQNRETPTPADGRHNFQVGRLRFAARRKCYRWQGPNDKG